MIPQKGDGACFLKSIQEVLAHDHELFYPLVDIKERIMDEIIVNSEVYKSWHTNSTVDLLHDSLEYLASNKYTGDVVDVTVQACANCLNINFKIFQKHDDGVKIIHCESSEMSSVTVWLKYDRFSGKYHGADHYEAIVEMSEGDVEESEEDEDLELSTIPKTQMNEPTETQQKEKVQPKENNATLNKDPESANVTNKSLNETNRNVHETDQVTNVTNPDTFKMMVKMVQM